MARGRGLCERQQCTTLSKSPTSWVAPDRLSKLDLHPIWYYARDRRERGVDGGYGSRLLEGTSAPATAECGPGLRC